MYKKFYNLEVWKIGYDLLMEIYEITGDFPKFEQYALTSQIIRSANSVIANIAEAHGRYYYADKIRVLYIARAEIQETQSHLRVAFGRKYITDQIFKDLDNKYEMLCRKINAFIAHLAKTKQ
jgi:four helix bundle protein